jgi:copper chaperone
MHTTKLRANDISCAHCAMTIKRELCSLAGIESVEVDVASKTVELRYANDEALERAKALLDEIGYPVAS